MNQREMAEALGIDEALVSRYVRRGMPLGAVEAAQAWRRANVAPYTRTRAGAGMPPTGRHLIARDAPSPTAAPSTTWRPESPGSLDGGALPDPADVIEGMVLAYAFVPHDEQRQIACALGQAAAQRLLAGEQLGDMEPALRAALRAIPPERRDPLPYPLSVMLALVSHVMAPPAAGTAAADMTPEDIRVAGEFATQVAAGEWVLRAPGAAQG